MDSIDFGVVKEELAEAGCMHTMQVLVREHRYLASGNAPSVFILTDRCVYHGGTGVTGKKFKRIRIEDVDGVRESGRFLWRSVELRYRDGGELKSIFLCPFTGEPHTPEIDEDSFRLMLELLKAYTRK